MCMFIYTHLKMGVDIGVCAYTCIYILTSVEMGVDTYAF